MHTPEATQADSALQAGRFREAIAISQSALRKMPRDPELRFILAQAFIRTNASRQAVPHLKRLMRDHPGNIGFSIELANALDSSGSPEEALAEIDHALEEQPNHDFAIRIRVKILLGTGRSGKAWDDLSKHLDELPHTANIALSLGSVIPAEADHAPVIERLGEAAQSESTTAPNRRSAYFMLAKLYERSGEHEEAFSAATRANRLIPENLPDHHHARLFDQVTPKILEAIEPADLDASGIVLVCGMPRSGTTLTEQIIAAHPQAASAGEFSDLPPTVNTALQLATRDGIVPRELTTKLARGYIKALRERAGDRKATVLIDKLPINHIILGLAARLLPGVRVIRCTRDPRDIATSCYMMDFGVRHAYRSKLETLAEELLLHECAAKRWRTELGEAYYESRLEELIENPERNARRLVEHAGLEWDESCLLFNEQQAHVRTASTEQIRSGINARGVGRWKNYEKQLAPLIEKLSQAGLTLG